jgi:hypothetical protein
VKRFARWAKEFGPYVLIGWVVGFSILKTWDYNPVGLDNRIARLEFDITNLKRDDVNAWKRIHHLDRAVTHKPLLPLPVEFKAWR